MRWHGQTFNIDDVCFLFLLGEALKRFYYTMYNIMPVFKSVISATHSRFRKYRIVTGVNTLFRLEPRKEKAK